MTDTTTPQYRFEQFEAGFIWPMLLRPELAAVLESEEVYWDSDWQVGQSANRSANRVSGIYGRVIGEAVHWLSLGCELGIFPDRGEINGGRLPTYFYLGDAFEELDLEEHEPRNGRSIEDHRSFNAALAAAIEDVNPDRLEFVRVTRLASAADRQRRIDELYSASQVVELAGEAALPGSLVDSISWALGGQLAAVDAWDSPANWRATREQPTDEIGAVLWAALAVAEGALAARLGHRLPQKFVIDLMYGESLDGSRDPIWRRTLSAESQAKTEEMADSAVSTTSDSQAETSTDERSVSKTEATSDQVIGSSITTEEKTEEQKHGYM